MNRSIRYLPGLKPKVHSSTKTECSGDLQEAAGFEQEDGKMLSVQASLTALNLKVGRQK